MQLLFSALPLLLAALCAHAWGPWHPHHRRDNNTLYATAVVGKNNVSTLECWALQPGFTAISSQANAMALGDSSGMSYLSVAPGPDYDSGTHNAPHIQYFVILQGSATITFPNTSEVLTCVPGQIYIAADSADVSALGHHTTVAGGSQLVQLPILNGVLPAHNATPGACP